MREWNDQIIFLRKILEGSADRSYGIQVARLGGLPKEIIARAKDILEHLESNTSKPTDTAESKPKSKRKPKGKVRSTSSDDLLPETQSPQLTLFN